MSSWPPKGDSNSYSFYFKVIKKEYDEQSWLDLMYLSAIFNCSAENHYPSILPHIITVRGTIFIINIIRITGYEHPMSLLSDRHQKKDPKR
jgi:hypothetical protein